MTNTITIDAGIYEGAAAYAQTRNKSLDEMIDDYVRSLASFATTRRRTKRGAYDISPTIRAMAEGVECPEGLSLDYKKEMHDILAARYL